MVSASLLQQYKSWFISYTQQYLLMNQRYRQNIMLKIEHTYRVIDESKRICKELNFSKEDVNLAELLALFHDIGRFEQYSKYRTFSDKRSENHAILGINELKKHEVLHDLKPSQQEFIYRVILYHNRAALPENETPKTLLFSRLLRDADKLDVFHLLVHYFEENKISRNSSMELELPHTEGFNYSIYNDLMSERIILFHDLINANDFKLMLLGWIYDINFQYTLQKIAEKKYIPRILELLPLSDKMQDLSHKMSQYINQKLKKTA